MRKIMLTVAALIAIVAITQQTQAQSTSSEGNAANPAQSRNGNVRDNGTEAGKSRAGVSRNVTGLRPDSNSTSNKFGRSSKQEKQEARSPSRSDGNVTTKNGRPKADPKTKKERGKGRSFGNTGSDTP